MAVINDRSNRPQTPNVTIYAEDHAEKLVCSVCGKRYVSRGKYDPGICRECQKERDAALVGGPLNGEPAK